MNAKKLIAAVLVFVMALNLCACAPQADPTDTTTDPANTTTTGTNEITVTDMVGRSVTIVPGSYKKVVCIGAGALRMYSYVGDVSLLCGVEDIDNTTLSERPQMFDSVARPYLIANEEVFSKLPSCGVGGPMAQAAEAEKILSCGADIVISEFEDADKSDALQQQLGVPVITLVSGAKGVFDEQFFGSLSLLGTIFEKTDRAEEVINFVTDQSAQIKTKVLTVAEESKPGVYICGLGNWGTTNHLMTAQDYVSFEVANVKNAVTGLSASGVTPLEEETFVALGGNMDIMIIDAAAVKNIKPLYAEDSTMFDTCKAWTDGEVYLQMAYNAYYTNYEIALINTWFVAKTVYPELFEDVDMIQKTDEITKAFLGKELADEIFAYPSSFGGYGKIDTATFFQ